MSPMILITKKHTDDSRHALLYTLQISARTEQE